MSIATAILDHIKVKKNAFLHFCKQVLLVINYVIFMTKKKVNTLGVLFRNSNHQLVQFVNKKLKADFTIDRKGERRVNFEIGRVILHDYNKGLTQGEKTARHLSYS